MKTLMAVLLLATVTPASPSLAEEPPTLLLAWGSGGIGDNQFGGPSGIAVSTTGFVYVSDVAAKRVLKFTTDSVFVTYWGSDGTGPGQFNGGPVDVTVDGDGYVYANELNGLRVQKFDGNGAYIAVWSSLSRWLGTDLNGGFVYATDGANTVRKYTTAGLPVDSWTYGSPDITSLRGIGVSSDGNVYVADAEGHKVLTFASDGTLLAAWGSFGTGDDQFDTPKDVAVGPDGNVYVVDSNAVRKFTPSGTFLTRWGHGGNGVAIDPDGNIYVLITFAYRVEKYGQVTTSAVPTTWGRIKSLYRDARAEK